MNGRRRHLILGMVAMLFTGVLYAWSILKVPLADEFGWNAADLGRNFTITISMFAIGGFAGGKLVRKASPRFILLGAGALTFLGFFFCTRLTDRGLVGLYLCYGGLCGFGIGIAYNVIVSLTTAWFPERRGMCSGLLMMCFGISTLLLGGAAASLMDDWGWRSCYVIIGACIAAALALNAFSLRAPADFHEKKDGKAGADGLRPKEMLRRSSFWLFCIYIVALCAGANMVIGFGSDIAMEMGAESEIASILVGLLSVCNGAGRLLCGLLCDRIHIGRVMCLASVVASAAIVLTTVSVGQAWIGAGALGMALVGIGYGFSPTILSTFCAEVYGPAHFSENFSLASFTLIPTSLFSSIAGMLVTSSGSYASTLFLGCGLGVLSLVLALCLTRRSSLARL